MSNHSNQNYSIKTQLCVVLYNEKTHTQIFGHYSMVVCNAAEASNGADRKQKHSDR